MPVKKRIGLFLLTVAWLFSLVGCADLSALFAGEATIPDPDKYRAEFSERWCYSRLNGRLRTGYGILYTALADGFDREDVIASGEASEAGTKKAPGIAVPLGQSMTKDELRTVYEAVLLDNPDFFYIHNTYYLSPGETPDGYTHILLRYTMNRAARTAARQALEEAAAALLDGLPESADEYDRELFLYDRLTRHCTYDQTAAGEGYDRHPTAYTAYGALVEQQAVCEGYARALQLLLNRAEIACVPVTGKNQTDETGHMWNLARINGALYYLDATFDADADAPRHDYFNITTEQLLFTHRLDDSPFWGETCAATEANYFVRQGTSIDTYTRTDIARAIADRVRRGEQIVELRFAPDKYANGLLFLKNSQLTREYVNACLTDSPYQLSEYRLFSREEQRVLILRLS